MIDPKNQKLIDVTIKECKDCIKRGDVSSVNELMVNVARLDGSLEKAKQHIANDPNYLSYLLDISKIGKIKNEEDLLKHSKKELLQMSEAGWLLMALEKEGLVKLPWKNQNDCQPITKSNHATKRCRSKVIHCPGTLLHKS